MLVSERLLKISRKTHKWLMLVVGLQFLLWSISGFYMVVTDIDFIHGDNLVNEQYRPLNQSAINYSIAELMQEYPKAQQVELTSLLSEPVYSFKLSAKQQLVSARDGRVLPDIDQGHAKKLARYYYSGQGEISSIELLIDQAPTELSPRHLPVWRVDFDDFASPSLYISQRSGKLVTKRHNFWRIFDWMWRIHIVDYDDGETIDNIWLFAFAALGIFAAVAGAILTYFRVFNKQLNTEEL